METVRKFISKEFIAGTFLLALVMGVSPCDAQEEIARHVKTRVSPTYPEMARRYGISGTVKLAVVVAPNGSVKNATATGGHPVLVNAAVDAVKKWKFEPASAETTGTVEVKFASAQDN